MKPTIEQIKAWTLEVAREVGFEPMGSMEDETAGIDYDEWIAALLVCTKAASWARKQALEDAVEVCDNDWNGDPDIATYSAACNECAEAIRALIKQEESK